DALADLLGVNVGDRLTLVSTVVPITPLGEFIRQKQFTVGGIFRVGSQLDSGLVIAHMADVQRVYRLGDAIQGLRLQVDDLFDVNTISQDIRSNVSDNFQIANWTWDYGNIYENIRLSKTLVGLLLSLLIAVAAFNVVVSLVMIVREKEGDIAILRAMGASLENIRNIFLVQGFSIGIMGTGAGLFLGLFFALTVSDIVTLLEKMAGIEFLSADIYPVNYLPSQIEFADVFLVCCVSLLLTVLATLLPARSAALVDPAEALRYE
ncbi:MAG: FtsX-like permease family protein, partial [Gammaproteobacteria bacterium]